VTVSYLPLGSPTPGAMEPGSPVVADSAVTVRTQVGGVAAGWQPLIEPVNAVQGAVISVPLSYSV